MGRKSRAKRQQRTMLAAVPLGTRHPTPGPGRYGLPAWVVVPDDLQLPLRDGQLPGWSAAATVLDFHLPDQLRRAIPRAHLDEWITVFEQQERTALAALEQAATDGILGAVTVCDGSCGNVDLVGVLFNLQVTP